MAAFEKTAVGEERWTPAFTGRPAAGAAARRASRRGPVLVVLGLLAASAIGGGLWYYLRARPAASAPPPATTLARIAPASTTPATAPAVAPTVNTAPSAAAATPPPPPTTAAPARASGPVSLAQARALLRQGQLSQAARGFEANVKGAPSGTLSVQLLVACAPETVQKAVDGVRSDELFILPVHYKGRDCFRMCWGLYSTPAKAASAVRALPEYFRVGGAAPKVQPVASLLP